MKGDNSQNIFIHIILIHILSLSFQNTCNQIQLMVETYWVFLECALFMCQYMLFEFKAWYKFFVTKNTGKLSVI